MSVVAKVCHFNIIKIVFLYTIRLGEESENNKNFTAYEQYHSKFETILFIHAGSFKI